MGRYSSSDDDSISENSSEEESLSDFSPLPPILQQQIEAARDKAWQTFQAARTRSQKYSTAWAYFRLGGSFESRWPQANVIFREYRHVLVDWLDEPTFCPAGTPSITREEYHQRWSDPPEFIEFEQNRALADAPAFPDPAPSSQCVLPVSLPTAP